MNQPLVNRHVEDSRNRLGSTDTQSLSFRSQHPTSDTDLSSAAFGPASGLASRGLRVFQAPERPTGIPLFPRTIDGFVARVAAVRNLFFEGKLHDEVNALGVSTKWLEDLHRQAPTAAFSEHPGFLPALFYKLGHYGAPAAMVRALQDLKAVSIALRHATGAEEVKVGIFASPDHAVTFSGITNYAFLRRPGTDGGETSRKYLFSERDKKLFSGCGYRDLTLDPAKVEEVVKSFKDLGKYYDTMSRKPSAGGGDWARRAKACSDFLEDWQGASNAVLAQGSLVEGQRVPYVDFISEINSRVSVRFGGPSNFGIHYSDAVNSLATSGIEDWYTFVNRMTNANIVGPNEPIVRMRVNSAEGQKFPRYVSLSVVENSPSATWVADKAGNRFNIKELQEASQKSVAEGNGLLLIPIAELRYLVNFAWSKSALLDDGMPYAPIFNVARAVHDGRLTPYRRGLTIFPYTDLSNFTPKDHDQPYADLGEVFDVIDYYSHNLTND